MRILVVGDLHLRTKTPRRRTDVNFEATCLGKLRQIVRIGNERADAVVQVGDFFDVPDPSKGLIAGVISSGMFERKVPWFAIHGQHDLRFHSQQAAARSALGILQAAKCLTVLDGDWLHFTSRKAGSVGSAVIYSAPFGREAPRPEPDPEGTRPDNVHNDGYFKLLVAHAMVGDKPLWPGHDLTGPEDYVRKNPGFDLYCLGDYHYPYSVKVGDAWVVNAGAVLRLTADERDRKRRPKVVLFDTDAAGPEDIFLDVAPEGEAFDLSAVEADREQADRSQFGGMVEALRVSGDLGTDFKANLAAAMDAGSIPESVRDKAWRAWGGV